MMFLFFDTTATKPVQLFRKRHNADLLYSVASGFHHKMTGMNMQHVKIGREMFFEPFSFFLSFFLCRRIVWKTWRLLVPNLQLTQVNVHPVWRKRSERKWGKHLFLSQVGSFLCVLRNDHFVSKPDRKPKFLDAFFFRFQWLSIFNTHRGFR